jgi:hypothetical protein
MADAPNSIAVSCALAKENPTRVFFFYFVKKEAL